MTFLDAVVTHGHSKGLEGPGEGDGHGNGRHPKGKHAIGGSSQIMVPTMDFKTFAGNSSKVYRILRLPEIHPITFSSHAYEAQLLHGPVDFNLHVPKSMLMCYNIKIASSLRRDTSRPSW